MDYKKTLNLPRTSFPMKANLVNREPEVIARWEEQGVYGKVRAARAGRRKYILHDGPRRAASRRCPASPSPRASRARAAPDPPSSGSRSWAG